MAYSQRSPQGTGSGTGKSASRSVGYFHVQLRDSAQFKNFRTEQLDKQGRIQRITGQRANSSAWMDQELRISKDCAHIENHRLIADTDEARSCLGRLGAVEHVSGDVFRARQADEKYESQARPAASQAEAPQRRAQSMADKEREALGRRPAGQREQERPLPGGKGK